MQFTDMKTAHTELTKQGFVFKGLGANKRNNIFDYPNGDRAIARNIRKIVFRGTVRPAYTHVEISKAGL